MNAPDAVLPAWRSVLAVVAHPDDESFGLGAILSGFADAGARIAVLCLTHGEASTVHGAAGDLYALRSREFNEAAKLLGVQTAVLLAYQDGHLGRAGVTRLAREILDVARAVHPEGLLAFDPSGVTRHPDHIAATAAACRAAHTLDLPVLGWALPGHVADALNAEHGSAFAGHPPGELDLAVRVQRKRQCAAIAAHASQAVASSVLWRRLELLGDVEYLRWLRR